MFQQIHNPQERLRAVVDAATVDGQRCFNVKDNVTRYLRSADQMIRTAKWKKDNGAEDEAFYLFVKFSTLYLNKVRQHPGFKLIDPAEQRSINGLINYSLDEAEELKPMVLKKFEDEEALRRSNEDAEEMSRVEREMAVARERQQIEQKHRQHHDDAVLAQQIQQEEQYSFHKDRAEAHLHMGQQQRLPAASQVVTSAEAPPAANRTTMHHSSANSNVMFQTTGAAPTVPAATPLQTVDRSSKPFVRHHSAVFTLRRVILPGDLASTFLRLSLNNTARDTETCGVLGAPASANSSNELRVSHVLLPPQRGTPDSCTTEDEEKLFKMVEELDLVVVGWIHTHPSQTAFLSSVDLHTQAGYQHLFPESVAVVCSVKFNDIKVFRLTAPGLDVVSACDQTGFHTHPGTTTGEPLFDECSPEELKWDNDGSHVQVVDLRG